jgi:murein DD-endopeptidase MepM/ murein hydrolase activator NlpD
MIARATTLALLLTLATTAQAAEPNRTISGKSTKAKAPVTVVDQDPETELEHLVKPGETLGGIAIRAKVPRVLIIEANHLHAPFAVREGQKLMLPRTRHHIVKAGETGFDIGFRYGLRFADIAVANGLEPDAKVKVGQDLLIPSLLKPAPDKAEPKATDADAPPRLAWPLEGKIRRNYSPRTKLDANGDYHEGLDIIAPLGTAARAVAGGTVVFAAREPENFGNLVVIDHGHGWGSAYAFLSKITVKRGDIVKPHERIGLVGHEGRATRDELHFEFRHNERPVNPLDYLPERAQAAAPKQPSPDKPSLTPKPKTPRPSAKSR